MAITFTPFKGRQRSVSIRVQGLEKLQRELKATENSIDSDVTKEIHRAALRIARNANRDVPVDTGRLLKSIDVEKWTRAAAIHVKAPYAGFVEKGTRFMRAQPYFFKHIDPAIKILMQNLKKLAFK